MDDYDRLVEFYRMKLEQRYQELCERPGVAEAEKLLAGADQETVRKVLELLRNT